MAKLEKYELFWKALCSARVFLQTVNLCRPVSQTRSIRVLTASAAGASLSQSRYRMSPESGCPQVVAVDDTIWPDITGCSWKQDLTLLGGKTTHLRPVLYFPLPQVSVKMYIKKEMRLKIKISVMLVALKENLKIITLVLSLSFYSDKCRSGNLIDLFVFVVEFFWVRQKSNIIFFLRIINDAPCSAGTWPLSLFPLLWHPPVEYSSARKIAIHCGCSLRALQVFVLGCGSTQKCNAGPQSTSKVEY